MASQPNLASRSEVVSIYKCPSPKGVSPKIGAQKHHIFDHLFRDFRTPPHLCSVTWHQQTKMLVSIYNVLPKIWATFPWPLTQKRLRSVGSFWHTLWKFSIFHHCWASHWNATETRPTKFCHMLEGSRGLLSTVNILVAITLQPLKLRYV